MLSMIMTVFTVFASVTGTSGTQESIFNSVWVVLLLALFVVVQVICLFTLKPKFTLYRAGFYLLHIGLVLLLAGCFIYYIAGDMVNVTVPVDSTQLYRVIKRREPDSNGNDTINLDFSIGVSNFEVERYEPQAEGMPATDKYYQATLLIMPEGSRDIEEIPLIVNEPHHESGWKIYLMNYDRVSESAVQLMMKYDPGEYVTLTGIWMIIAGSVVMCLLRKEKAGDSA